MHCDKSNQEKCTRHVVSSVFFKFGHCWMRLKLRELKRATNQR